MSQLRTQFGEAKLAIRVEISEGIDEAWYRELLSASQAQVIRNRAAELEVARQRVQQQNAELRELDSKLS
jgi:hypothetical protein